MKIEADHPALKYVGRIELENPKEPVWVYPCTWVEFRFTGTSLKVSVRNKRAYWDGRLGYFLDGEQGKFLLPEDGEITVEIPVMDTSRKEHDFMLFKRQDACHQVTILGFELEDGEQILPSNTKYNGKIEVYGDSVSAGEVSEALHCVGQGDPEHNGEYSNSYYSYPWILARSLGAELHNNAQGGLALLDGTGWFSMPDTIGLESIWDKVCYNPTFQRKTDWDFQRYTPDLCIVAVGQNDQNPDNYMMTDYEGEKAKYWRMRYKEFLLGLREKYPKAHILCCTTLLYHDEAWDLAIGEVVADCRDEKMHHYLFHRNGKGTPGHHRIPEAEEMAAELKKYIDDCIFFNTLL